MEAHKVQNMCKHVPTATKQMPLNSFASFSGTTFRSRVVKACVIPLLFAADINGGVTNLGFSKTTMKEEFKAKPDHLTGRVFVAHRQGLWSKSKSIYKLKLRLTYLNFYKI